MKLRESVLQWLRLIQDSGGLIVTDIWDGYRDPNRPTKPMLRHLVRMGYVQIIGDHGCVTLAITHKGRLARRTEQVV